MDITSIDNCYEDDGLVMVQSFLYGLNAEAQQTPPDPLRRVLVAVLPEFLDDGRLSRLNFVCAPAADPGLMTDAEVALMDAAAAVVSEQQAKRAAAYANVKEPTVVPMPEAGAGGMSAIGDNGPATGGGACGPGAGFGTS